jgi:hypothetical protein
MLEFPVLGSNSESLGAAAGRDAFSKLVEDPGLKFSRSCNRRQDHRQKFDSPFHQ